MNTDFTVHIATSLNGDLSLRDEITLTKVALLFADNVVLSSATLSLLRAFERETNDPRMVEEFIVRIGGSSEWRATGHSPRSAGRTIQVARTFGVPGAVDDSDGELRRVRRFSRGLVRSKFEDAGGPEIVTAQQSGLLVVDDLGMTHNVRPLSDIVASLAGGPFPDDFFCQVYQRLMTTAATARYPLLSKDVTKHLRDFFSAVDAPPPTSFVNRVRLPMFSDTVLRTLPIEAVTMEDALAIRHEVEPSAIAFRAEMARFASAVQTEPWSEDFPSAAKYEFDVAVRPKIKDLEIALMEASVVRRLWNAARGEVQNPTAATLTGFLATLGITLTDYNPAFLLCMALGLPFAAVSMRTRAMLMDHREATKRNGLALYCLADKAIDRVLATSSKP